MFDGDTQYFFCQMLWCFASMWSWHAVDSCIVVVRGSVDCFLSELKELPDDESSIAKVERFVVLMYDRTSSQARVVLQESKESRQ